MRISLILIALLALGLPTAVAVPESQCTTTLRVNTCGQTPVEDHKVKIAIRDGEKIKERTDEQGEITLGVCPEDISQVKVSGVPSERISKTTVFENTDNEILATITLNICDA